MALSDDSKINISLKKLAGKAQTSNAKDLANEGLPTGITVPFNTVFGEIIPTNPSKSSLYTITDNVVEYIRLSASFIAGTDTASGRHSFSLQLPDDYESNSSNPNAGTYPFKNKQKVYITSGSLQLVPTSFATAYEATPYHSSSNVQTQIPVLDARDWYLDYFNGVFFQQDPPATGDSDQNPRYVDAFLYIGKFANEISGQGKGDPNAEYLVLAATGSLPNERVFTPGIGLKSVDSGAGAAYTLDIWDAVVATLTGSQFSGNVGITGSFGATSTSIFGNGSSLSGLDNNFFVSGAIDSKGTSARGTAVFGGDLAVSGALALNQGAAAGSQVFVTTEGKVGIGTSTPAYKLSVGGNMEVGEYIYHRNDSNTFIQFADDSIGITAGGEQLVTISESPTFVKIGDGGDVDFQVRTLGDDNALYVRGDTDRVGIGLNGPATKLHVKDTSPVIRIQRSEQIETSMLDFAGKQGFVGASIAHEGLTNDLRFSVFNGSNTEEILRLRGEYSGTPRQVIFLSGSGMHGSAMQPRNSLDLAFFVSGSIGSKGTGTRGTAVFGGDLFASGAFFASSGLSGSLTRLPDGSSYLVGGTGINISSASNGAITISLGSSERTRFDRVLVNNIDNGSDVDVSSDFSSANFSINKIDVFVNGQLVTSGTNRDYLLNTSKTGSIHFNFDLLTDDIVTTVVNK